MLTYYSFLSSLSNLINEPLRSLDSQLNIPIFTALILGLIGAASPCQLTTNITALAYVSRETTSSRRVIGSAVAYLLGKMVVYSTLGIIVILTGIQLSNLAIPIAIVVRKALGPLLILLGMLMLGVLRFNFSVGQGISTRLEGIAGNSGRYGPFLLGIAFAFAFCPTLFWLFFGLVIPLSLSSPAGVTFPGVFAIGTTTPLLAFAGLIALGTEDISKYAQKIRRFDIYIQRTIGVIFIIAGINEVVLYWLL